MHVCVCVYGEKQRIMQNKITTYQTTIIWTKKLKN